MVYYNSNFYLFTQGAVNMDNYLDMIDDYLKTKNDLICFNSYSNYE